MPSLPTTERQLQLLRTLAAHRRGCSVADLADRFETSLKTIRRDLTRLRAAGFPLHETTEQHGRRLWSLPGSDLLGGVLGFDEAFALHIAVAAITPLAGTEIGEAAASAMDKLGGGLSATATDYCRRLAGAVVLMHGREVDYSRHGDILAELMRGLEEQRSVYIAYQSRTATEPISYPLHPYAIRVYRAAIYILGHSEQHDAVRHFKLDRMTEAELTQVQFTRPKNFDAEEYLASAFGIFGGDPVQVTLTIAPAAARPITESRWHASQQTQRHADGSVTLRLCVALTPELVGWIMSIGPDAVVLSPAELIDQVAEQAIAIANRYATVGR